MKTRYKKVFARALSAVLSAAMLLSSAVTAFAATETASSSSNKGTLLYSFDFEDNTLPSQISLDTSTSIAAAPDTGHGLYSVKRESVSDASGYTALSIKNVFEKGVNYIIQFDYYIPTESTAVWSTFNDGYQNENWGWSGSKGAWYTKIMNYTPSDSYNGALSFIVPSVIIYYDNIKIYNITGVENTAANATFENGKLPENVTANGFSVKPAPDAAKAHGNYSLYRTDVNNSNFEIKLNTALTSGKAYDISFYLWAETDTQVTIYNPYTSIYKTYEESESWQKHSYRFVAEKDYDYVVILIYSANCYVDDITVTDETPIYYPYINTVKNRLDVSTDFSDYETSSERHLYYGNSMTLNYEQDETEGTVASTIIRGSNVGKDSMLAFPYLLKAGKTYQLTIRYKADGWACVSYDDGVYNSDISFNGNGTTYRTETKTITLRANDHLLYIGTTNNNVVNFSISSFSLKEVFEYQYPNSNKTQDNLYVISDFSDYETSEVGYLMPGANVAFAYKYDETLKQTVAEATINADTNGGDGATKNQIGIPYLLKADTTYTMQITLKTDAWICLAYKYNNDSILLNGNGETSFTAGNGYQTRSITIKPYADTCVYIGTTVGTPNVTVASYIIKEKVASTNTASKQVYDFGLLTPENYKDTTTVLIADKDGKLTEALAFDTTASSGKGAGVVRMFKLDNALTNGRVYKLSYDYKGEANFRILLCTNPDGWGENAGMYSADKAIGMHYNKHIKSDSWTTYSSYFKAESDSTYMYLRVVTTDGAGDVTVNSEFFLDNIVIEEVTLTPGDMDGSGAIDASDITALRKVLLGVNDPLIIDWAGNISNVKGESTGVDIRDLVALKKKIAGIEPAATPATYTAQNYASAEAAVRLTTDSNSNIEAGVSTFSLAPSEQATSENGTITYSYKEDGYIVFKLNGSITEGAVEYDISAYKLGDLDIEVSPDGINYTNENITPQDISGERINDGWVRYTAYYKFDSAKYIKINFPKELGGNMRVRKVRLNGCDAQTLYNMHGFNSSLRAGKTVYVSSGGSSENDGTDINNPTTIDAAFSRMLAPGDKILLKSGDTFSCTGGVKVLSSGTDDNPIYIGSYGDGAKPVIADFTGVGLTLTGENITVENIAFTSPSGKTGIKAFALCGESKNLTVKNCKFYNINTNSEKGSHSRDTGGTAFLASGNNPSWFNGITVENNEYDSIARGAFFASSDWCARDTSQNDGIADWGNKNLVHASKLEKTEYPILGIVVKNNSINKCGGDAINVIGTKGALLEYNTVADSKLFYNNTSGNIAFASIWCHSSDECVIQYNEVYGNSSANEAQDLQAFDIDIGCNNCIVQYNYSHNNAGGFMLLCGGDGKNNGQVTGSIVRYNLSVNDGYDNENKNELQVIDITGTVRNSQIYNNTIYCGKKTRAVNFSNYGNYSESSSNTVFTNNIFYAANGVEVTWGYQTGANNTNNYAAMQSASFDHNLFYNISEPNNTYYDNKVTVTNSTFHDPEFSDPQEVNGRLEAIKHFYVGKGNDVIGHAAAVVNKNIADYEGNTITPQNPILGAVYHAYTTAD